MRYMIIVKATSDSEAGVMPSQKLLEEMGQFHEELAAAGILRDASGLKPSSQGWRIDYSGDKKTLTDGPFAETKELVAGYTIIEVASREEALEWTRRYPNPAVDRGEGEVEVREFFELDDLEPSEALERFRELDMSPHKPIPEGMHSITPHLVCATAANAIDFYERAFGAVELSRLTDDDGHIMHAALRIGDSVVMMTEELPEWNSLGPLSRGGSSVTIHLYVEDVDAAFERAVAAGAKSIMGVDDMFWGDRYGVVEDPFGHRWSLATHVRDVAPNELRAAMARQPANCPTAQE